MKIFHSIIVVLVLLNYSGVIAQCGTTGETLFIETQEDINDIMLCDSIFGSLSISNWNISSLDSLSNLSYIEEDFILSDNTSLLNVEGLGNLHFIGGDLILQNNFTLQYLDGLDNLSYVGGDVFILGNITLIDVDGLAGLSQINGHLVINENHTLENLDGFQNVQHVIGDIRLEELNSILNDLNGLSSIIGIDSSLYISLPSATTIDGFNALQAVEGTVSLENMDLLASVSGLNALVEIGSSLHIENNSNLVSLNGLETLQSITDNLEVIDNPALFHCCGIEHLLDNSVGGSILIENNANGCNSPEEIIDDCYVHVGQIDEASFGVFNLEEGVQLDLKNFGYRDIAVFDAQGRRVLFYPDYFGNQLRITLENSGLYIISVYNGNSLWTQRVIR